MQGKGGGKAESAQATGTNPSSLQEAVSVARKFASKKLGQPIPTVNIPSQAASKPTSDQLASKKELTFKITAVSQPLKNVKSSGPVLYTDAKNISSCLPLLAAQYSGKTVVLASLSEAEKSSTIPKGMRKLLQSGQAPLYEDAKNNFFLFGSSAIALYFSNENFRGGSCDFKQAEMLQWLQYADNTVLHAVSSWVCPDADSKILKHGSVNNSKEKCIKVVNYLDRCFFMKTFIVGERLSLADIALFCSLLPLYQNFFDSKLQKQYPHVTRWFKTIMHQPDVVKVIGVVTLCNRISKN
ncbi:hypothetical protein PR048_023931 [Dryococelus australis]|uniref:GST C-terminal domain-containing protein n=1 Tax=Dryococelus australis TaxID=614101 RepID=A0ABQ9GVJ0_9NEOP|nr:hypothetical protein PR048_023931 [Dryococelus australis]